jgi:hypothetical protein
MSGSAVGNNNQYVDTGLSYMTRRRQGNKEVVGSWLGRLPASLGSCYVTATFHHSVIKWPAVVGQGRPLAGGQGTGSRVVSVLNRDNSLSYSLDLSL